MERDAALRQRWSPPLKYDEEGRSIADRFGEIKPSIQQTRLEQAKLREGMVVAPAIPNPQSRNLIGTGFAEAALDTGVGLGLKGVGLGLKAAGGLIGRTSVQTGLPKRALGQAAKGQIGGSSAVQQEIAGAPGIIGAKLHPSEEWGRSGYTPKLLGRETHEGPWAEGPMAAHQHNEASRELWALKWRNESGWISNPKIKDNSNTFYVLRKTEGRPHHRGAVLGGAFEEFDGQRHLVELHVADDVIDNDAAISRLIDEAEDQFDTYYAGARGAEQYIEPWSDAGVSELRRRGYEDFEYVHPRTGSSMWKRGDATTAGASYDEVDEARRLWSEQGTDSPYFKHWFGDSPVVGADGDPLVLYRGSRTSRGMLGRPGYAAFASDNPGVASGYGDTITPLYVKADKVIEYTKTRTNVGFDDAAMRLRPGEALVVRKSRDAGPMHKAGQQGLQQEIIGPDGKVKVFTDVYSGDIWAFPPGTPSKSAIANRGTFDPTNPHISYGTAALLPAAAAHKAMSGEAEGEEASIDNPHGRK
jgi:hypothetical protein